MEVKPFDIAEFLGDRETITEFLNLALREDDSEHIVACASAVARACGQPELDPQADRLGELLRFARSLGLVIQLIEPN